MCGIVGVYCTSGLAQAEREPLARAAERIAHRGPDDEGQYFDGPVGLGFRRLSILDLTPAGHQPMTAAAGTWTVVFNGEIYNYIEIAEELRGYGVTFRSESDTEVLVEALHYWGIRCFERFNGMWAVLAWHRPSRTLYACRDPWGIKPLFLCEEAGRGLFFASEIKALSAFDCHLGDVEPQTAARFVHTAILDFDDRTFFSNVKRLAPGFIYSIGPQRPLGRTSYSDCARPLALPPNFDSPSGEAAFIEQFRETFLDSVRIRLRADVAVGTCLSGGLDSSSIACAAARLLSRSGDRACRHAFTAQLPEFDESTYLRAVVAQTAVTWHTTVSSDDEVTANIGRFFQTHDEPVHSLGAFAGFMVMKLAAEANVKVLLNGQGSDEALAGYSSTVLPYLRSLLVEDGWKYAWEQAVAEAHSTAGALRLMVKAEAGLVIRAMPREFESLLRQRLQRTLDLSANPYVARDGPLRVDERPGLPPSDTLALSLHDQQFRTPLPTYLRIEDTNSSAFSLESRLPFLDPRLMELARVAPARLLRRGGNNKYLLRSILPGLVPEVVWKRRDKMGFPVPHSRWYHGPVRSLFADTMSNARLRSRGWYDLVALTRARDAFLNHPEAQMTPELMRCFLLERWAREKLDAVAPSRRTSV